ncbi:LETM1-related biofilm-associated protein [Ulvibacter litoralis]|uniref:LETM1-like protein n=1 Tax=Ulvibacter litoralis TaxID=227084 RepID=A0A1G7F016_9FLAO|nr:LETM1-related biofilm-associated protein [Ulvibacter litoralis]GHC53244.1 hypothetical protein GCM10008083_16530 [Ulvibacter litoralis]SDE69288.1 LETM1-like protein [Ulvibacter litoralis]
MNPSAADWIPKFLDGFDKQTLTSNFTDEISFYLQLKSVGFIYGVSVLTLQSKPISHLRLTKEELTKVNLFHTLLFTFFQQYPEASYNDAIQSTVDFYKNIEKGKPGFFQKLTLSSSPTSNLEQILAARLQEANTVLKKNTASLVTFALLYADVLAYREFLKTPKKLKPYLDELESTIVSCCFLALRSKHKKNKYDKQLLELFKSSSDYLLGRLNTNQIFTFEGVQYLTEKDILEKKYILDLCILAIHDDHSIDASEYQFLQQLSILLDFKEEDLQKSIESLRLFSENHKTKIKLFEYSNPVNQFYKQSSKTVKNLILRNKDRLTKELEESGELVILLGNSAVRELTSEEKKKVKEQLLDICKTVPSLTIFLLPGGTILLPLLVKFIPKLLPSSFQDNRIDKKK